MARSRSIELRVGIFVFVSLAIGAFIVFTIGNQQNLFASKVDFRTEFTKVSGLRAGSPVRIAGVEVGSVTDVTLGDDGKIEVDFKVRGDTSHLIREQSVVEIASKGMLGDMLLEISMGSGPPIEPGGLVASRDPTPMSEYLTKAGDVLGNVERAVRNIHEGTKPLADPQFGEDLRHATHNLGRVLEMMADGDGPLNRLITDPDMSAKVDRTLSRIEQTSGELAKAARNVRSMTDEVRHGDSVAHEILYGDQGTELVQNLSDATGELAELLRSAQGDGETGDLVTNLTKVSADLRVISQDLRDGKGTLGALLVDPSVYEDVKRLVGDLERNEVLRALVRYSIKQDEAERPASVERVEK